MDVVNCVYLLGFGELEIYGSNEKPISKIN